ncbi:MAG TPA: metalloregulator ArsR/SmtB family transcription factor [Rugosimonospora sp.]|nr:metalloregulator ArsR/SmtB family transcription factor [Rugosimonospora sp.]
MEFGTGDLVADVLRAMGDPVRWAILRYIAAGREIGSADLAKITSVTRPTMAYHLRVLHSAGLVHMRRTGRHQYYRIRADGAREVSSALARLARRRGADNPRGTAE